MSKALRIDFISREIIKPSSPTPQHLRYIKLSLLDQLNFAMSTPVILFYPSKAASDPRSKIESSALTDAIKEKSLHLKSSLAKALTLFYPLAGKLVADNSCIECNDYGVEFAEARVSCSIKDLIQCPHYEVLEKLHSVDLNSPKAFTGAVIQVTFFYCGGLTIGVSLTHKIADAASLSTFLMAWASASLAKESPPSMVIPHFVSDTIIPSPKEFVVLPPPPPLILEKTKCKTRRYLFDASKVRILKAKAASADIQQPTRVEAVTAFIWKCLMMVSRSNSGSARKSVLIQAVNLRKRFVPPLPENYVGNLSGKFFVETNDYTIDLPDLVSRLREELEKVNEHVAHGVQATEMAAMLEFAKEFGELHSRGDVDLYSFASLCGFPFYEIDFGWGKATWATVTNLVLKNYVVLMDARDGKGVEAWMSLDEEDLALLDRNQELLAFATKNPGV